VQDFTSATLSAADRTRVDEAIQTIRDAMPFLQSITPEQRQRLRKMGLNSRGFVEAANTAAHQFTDALPRSFDLVPFDQDLALIRAYEPVFFAVTDLYERVRDTWTLMGSDAMKAADAVYHYLDGHPSVDDKSEVMRVLRARYANHRGRKPDDEEPAP
jgi:hypothetical protein